MKTKEYDVVELVKRAQAGDDLALSELITIHKRLVFTIIMRMVNDYHTSQDLTQDTFIKVCLNIHRVNDSNKFCAWICRIAKNIAYDHLRKEKRHRLVPLHEISEQVGENTMKHKRKSIIIQDALTRLSIKDRMLLSLAYLEGLALADVAEIMKIPLRNIRISVHRARVRLRRQLEGREDELMST